MHLPTLLTATLTLVSLPGVLGYPGMGKQLRDLTSRQDDGAADEGDSNELLGDLATLSDDKLTPVGKDIKDLLTGKGNPESNEVYKNVPAQNSAACKADTCCIWNYISKEMYTFMRGGSGRCTKWARFAVRLGFHDAGTWSKGTAAQGGGADGSIILSGTELTRPENNGLQEIGDRFNKLYKKYRAAGWAISMADLIQVGANVAAVTCPLGPRVKTYVGRIDSAKAAPDNLLPNVNSNASVLIQLFRDKTIGPHGLVALVGAHTTSQQHFVDPKRAGDPQDSTPGVWDVKFYPETTGTAPKRVFKFNSDLELSKAPETSKEWNEFAGSGGQKHWNEDYAREYIRLSLLGVNNINTLTECTKVLPAAVTTFKASDQKKIDKWLATVPGTLTGKAKAASDKIASDLNEGATVVTDLIVSVLGVILGGLL
ncbi:ligninase H2 [Plectosphaerella plurivora]|uniref:Peroxidase n=1 Tax=Plectosphaerella plurivora TaxID=936078 RepID=A0A9P8VFM4_9PEZI|nr:ligninase H2 [Plectosphaerella plurivora]